MKEFLDMAKEQKMDIPERLQKCLPDANQETRTSIKEQQRKLNRHRNVLHKLENKKKALEKDNEQWITWVDTMRQEIQQQKEKHEETQKKFRQDVEELTVEEQKIREQVDQEMEASEEEEKEPEEALEELLGTATGKPGADNKGKINEQKVNEALMKMQKDMETRYQIQLEQDRAAMRREMLEQLQQAGGTPVISLEESLDEQGTKEKAERKRNALALFGVERTTKTSQISSPYGRQKMETNMTQNPQTEVQEVQMDQNPEE